MEDSAATYRLFFAHSHEGVAQHAWHSLKDHLAAVGNKAATSAAKFGAEDLGAIAGKLHDLGKYSRDFQLRLCGEGRRVDHSTAGAQVAVEHYGRLGRLIAYSIAGHHAGLANGSGGGQRSTLEDRLALRRGQDIPALTDSAWRKEITLPIQPAPSPLGRHPDGKTAEKRNGFRVSFLVRMLFSCLVDADCLDTEQWFAHVESRAVERGAWPSIQQLKSAVDQHLERLERRVEPTGVNGLRAEVLHAARAAAALEPGLFSFTVPTGGGKTLSGLAFALDHAERWSLDRVIYVAPFTSVIEQNADAFRRAVSPFDEAVLEHHSAFRDEELLREKTGSGGEQGPEAREKLKLAMENWDAPIVATTAVQFFESLFAATPAKCRKLHNIARSVVILDEAQSLPLPLLRPCIAAIDELARNYKTSVVLCTATQPAIEDRPETPERSFVGGLRGVREIAPNRDGLFNRLQRVHVESLPEPLDDPALIDRLRACEQVLCIVNTRGHARTLYRGLRDLPGSRHLSTWMCAANRAQVLGEVHADLRERRPCRVVSTSLVEAGVDVDFPCVYRAEAGLDSIAQAAGRCNREGRRSAADSPVYVFQPLDAKSPAEIAQYAAAMRRAFNKHRDVLAPAAIEQYFLEVYWSKSTGRDDDLDKHSIITRLNERARDILFPFEDVAIAFQIIDDNQQPVLIPFDHTARVLIDQLRYVEKAAGIARRLQRYVVPVPRSIFARLAEARAIEPIRDDRTGRQFYELVNADLYRQDEGLTWDDPEFRDAEGMIL